MSLIAITKQALAALDIVGRMKRAFQSIQRIASLPHRVEELERKLQVAEQTPSPFRKCPKCGERDFRLIDTYRVKPDVFGPRFFHQKWLCYSCNHREETNQEEPD